MTEQQAARELAGSAAIVTGSARNIGRAIALRLADAGAAVLVNTRKSSDAAEKVADEIRANGGQAIVHIADVTDSGAVNGMVEAAIEAFGRLDFLVNNVARRGHTPIVETSDAEWRTILSSVLDASFYTIRAAVPHIARGRRGAIINIGGVSGHAGVKNRSHVAAAKAGLAGMTGSLAIELAPHNITVNCISPGYVETVRDGGVPAHFTEREVPLGRAASVDEIAALVRFLCGPGARYITGETIHVNGGWYVNIA